MSIRLSIGPEHLSRSVEVVASLQSIPAVPTQDWCEQAARTLLPLRRNALVCVSVAEVGRTGEIINLECTGGIRGDQQGAPIQADRLHPADADSFGWWITNPAGPNAQSTAALLRELSHSDKWPETFAGRRWAKFNIADLLIGVAPLRPSNPGRVVVVEMGVSAEVRAFDAGDAEVLVAVLPELAKRCRLAFGMQTVLPTSWLTPREHQILEQLALGRTVKQIATELSRSQHTVHDHVKSLHSKIGASTRGELIARFMGHIEACADKPAEMTPPVLQANTMLTSPMSSPTTAGGMGTTGEEGSRMLASA